MSEAMRQLVERTFTEGGDDPCWPFCRAAMAALDRQVPDHISQMTRIARPTIGAVVLFQQFDRNKFHAGVIWPDCLHFTHCRPPLYEVGVEPVTRVDRLSHPMYARLIDGYYTFGGTGDV